MVFVNEPATLILPDRDVQLGVLTVEQVVSGNLNRRTTADGETLELASTSRHPVRPVA
jgi:hypothetical protein